MPRVCLKLLQNAESKPEQRLMSPPACWRFSEQCNVIDMLECVCIIALILNLVYLPNLPQDQWRQLTLQEETLGLCPGHNPVDRLQRLELFPILCPLAGRDYERIGRTHDSLCNKNFFWLSRCNHFFVNDSINAMPVIRNYDFTLFRSAKWVFSSCFHFPFLAIWWSLALIREI